MTAKLPWTTPQLVEIAPPTRETRIELGVEAVRQLCVRDGRSRGETYLLTQLYRAQAALQEIARSPCRRLALRGTRVGWDCERLGAPLCESCIAAEALRGGSQGNRGMSNE